MADCNLIFSGSMIRALLDGRKTQTRRIIKPHRLHKPEPHHITPVGDKLVCRWQSGIRHDVPARFVVGDRVWCRETFYLTDDGESECAVYLADEKDAADHVQGIARIKRQVGLSDEWAAPHLRKRPSIHMPRWASRITLHITDVRIQRLQDISEADARAEGIERLKSGRGYYDPTLGKGAVHLGGYFFRASEAFAHLIDTLHGDGLWDSNPWVYALTFQVERANIDTPNDN